MLMRKLRSTKLYHKVFKHLKFELTNSHLFQQIVMQACHDNDVTVT